MRKLPIYLGLLAAFVVVVELLWHTPLQKGGEAPPVATSVTVVDALSGAPVTGTITRLVDFGDALGEPLPLREGSVDLPVGTPRLVRIEAPGYQSRVLAIGPEAPVAVPLSASTDDAVTVRVAGQVMMGRMFYVPPTIAGPAPLAGADDVVGHDRVLAAAAPLLADADLTVAGLGAPLVPDPYVGGELPPGYRGDKAVVLAQSMAVAGALDTAGVDVVSLADDHLMDALDHGLESTVVALDAAGVGHFGAGVDVDAAWTPAYAEVRGQVVAFLGCTTLGRPGRVDSSAAGVDTPGVANCYLPRLRREVAAAAAKADAVVVVLDGAARPGGAPSEAGVRAGVRRLAEVAAESGASVIAGGFTAQGPQEILGIDGVPWIESTGSLVTDQQQWAGLSSSIARVSLSGGRAETLTVDPLARVADRPVPVVGTLAAGIARQVRGSVAGLTTLGEGTAYWPAVGSARTEPRPGAPGSLVPLGNAWTLDGLAPNERAGRDLLWGTGSFEDLDTDPDATGSTLWALGKYVTTSMEAGCQGAQGLQLRRGPLSAKDVVISPRYRQPVTPGTRLTLRANVRLASEGASLEVRWYRSLDPTKRSSGAESVAILPQRLAGPCAPVRLDLVVPEGMVAAQPYVRLSPLHDVNLAAELRVDDVKLVAWNEPGAAGRRLDTVELGSGSTSGSGSGSGLVSVSVSRTTP